MTALNNLCVWEIADLLARGECSSVQVTQSVLDAIGRRDPHLGAYLAVDAETALADAAAADEARLKGAHPAAPLAGIPIGVKDVINVRGQPCTCASRILQGYVAPYDATAVARLRAQGALLVGRLNMDEFAMGSTTENSAYQVTRNPWDPARVPGGSSGGSAAAVAAGTAIAALGSDTGGSIRQPAAFCGCVGLKPSYGRVSRYGLTAYASSLDQIGPLTRCVRDAALLLQALAGADPLDATTVPHTPPDYAAALQADLRGLRLGCPREYFIPGMDPEVEQAVRQAIDRCRDLGAQVREISLPHTPYAIATYYLVATAEASANLARFDGVRYGRRVPGADPVEMYARTRAAGFGSEVKRRIILGTYALSSGYYDAYYVRAQQVRRLIAEDFAQAFQGCDAVLTPVAPTAAYPLGAAVADPLQMYLGDVFTVTANLAGLCGLAVPCGFTAAGLPVGLQILGPAFREETILRVGFAYEQATDWHCRRPPEPAAG